MYLRFLWLGIAVIGAIGQALHTRFFSDHPRRGAYLFYTNLSNVLVVLFYAALAAFDASFLKNAAIRLAVVSCITLTNLIYHFLLAPRWRKNPERAFENKSPDNSLIHYAVPFLAIAEWVAFAQKHMAWYALFSALVIPACYGAFALCRVWIVRRRGGEAQYPYYFMNPDRIGWGRTARNLVLMGIFCAALGAAFYGIGRVIG